MLSSMLRGEGGRTTPEGLGWLLEAGGLCGERIEGRVEGLPGLFVVCGNKGGGVAVASDVTEGEGSGRLLYFGGGKI